MKTTLILFSLGLALYTFITLQADEMRAVPPLSGDNLIPYGLSGIVDASAPKFGSAEWLTMCYNQYRTYEDRIRFCG